MLNLNFFHKIQSLSLVFISAKIAPTLVDAANNSAVLADMILNKFPLTCQLLLGVEVAKFHLELFLRVDGQF